MTNAGRLLAIGLFSAGLAACSTGSSGTPPPAPAATGNAGGGGAGLVYHAQINFTGFAPIQGTFDDTSLGTDFGSCSDFAKSGMNPVGGWAGPSPTQVSIGGQVVTFSLLIGQTQFKGPGSYPGTTFLGLKIGSDLYAGGSDAITVNADGSGSTSFTNAQGSGSNMVESRTITWTCSG